VSRLYHAKNQKYQKGKSLMSTTKTTAERIELQKEEIKQHQNQLKLLLHKQKKEERKARTHRICVRGAMLEGLLPDTILLSDERFKAFLERTTANGRGREILAAIVAEQKKEYDANNAVTVQNSNTATPTAARATS